ncbi:MAG TPA: hypothetical protein VFO36_10495, partial [Nitrospiraceae bacterium]|nr:hypothetical protein [Nitrospiraceae bacterium]
NCEGVRLKPEMLDVSPSQSGQFSIGTVLMSSCRLAWRNVAAILLISISIQTLRWFIDPGAMTISPLSFKLKLQSMGDALLAIANLLSYAVLTASTVYVILHDLSSYRPHLSDILDVGLRRILRVAIGGIGLTIAMLGPAVAVVASTNALGIPGIIKILSVVVVVSLVGTRMFVLVPSLVAESGGYFDSVRRSVALTKGKAWRIWALLLLILGFLWLAGIVFTAVGSVAVGFLPPAFHMIGSRATVVLFNAFYWVVWAILPAVTFHYLRLEKEGLDPGATAAVFD